MTNGTALSEDVKVVNVDVKKIFDPSELLAAIVHPDTISHRLFDITDVYLGSSAVKKDFRLRDLSSGAIWSRCVLRGFEFYSVPSARVLGSIGLTGTWIGEAETIRELNCKDNWDIRVDGWCR